MKRTGGGTFDPNRKWLYFTSSNAERIDHAARCHDSVLIAADHFMGRDGKINNTIRYLEKWLNEGRTVFLDSGVFTLGMDHARKHNLSFYEVLAIPPEHIDGYDALLNVYIELVKRYEARVWGYVEIDFGGTQQKRETRAMLESEGLNPIPVYHPLTDPWEYFDELAQSYDRICFANVVHSPLEVRKRILMTLWQRRRQYPHLWIHVLGYTVDQFLYALPFHSCDSSTFMSGARWGYVVDRTMGRRLPSLPPGFNYKRGSDDPERSHNKATQMLGFIAMSYERNWFNHFQFWQGEEWPPFRENEAVPQPSQKA